MLALDRIRSGRPLTPSPSTSPSCTSYSTVNTSVGLVVTKLLYTYLHTWYRTRLMSKLWVRLHRVGEEARERLNTESEARLQYSTVLHCLYRERGFPFMKSSSSLLRYWYILCQTQLFDQTIKTNKAAYWYTTRTNDLRVPPRTRNKAKRSIISTSIGGLFKPFHHREASRGPSRATRD